MPFGMILPEYEKAISQCIGGKDILDVMAGCGGLAVRLLSLGAKHVWCIEKQIPRYHQKHHRIIFYENYIEGFVKSHRDKTIPSVAFVSWPIATPTPGITELLERTEHIIYIGVNDILKGMCGSLEFWNHVTHRDVIEFIEGRQDLIIYGAKGKKRDSINSHESAALSAHRYIGNY